MWIDGKQYVYVAGILRSIAENYARVYDGLPLGSWKPDIYDNRLIAEFKADFDVSLSGIGRKHWKGVYSLRFSDYRAYGKLQRVVIADILGLEDEELEVCGFYQISQCKGRAYERMAEYLNGKLERTENNLRLA